MVDIEGFNKIHELEVVMIGLDDECKKYSAEISVLDHETKAPVFKTTYQPRHISTQGTSA